MLLLALPSIRERWDAEDAEAEFIMLQNDLRRFVAERGLSQARYDTLRAIIDEQDSVDYDVAAIVAAAQDVIGGVE